MEDEIRSTLTNLLDSLEIGGRLPSERVLAAQMAVSRRELRRVLSKLESEGAVWRGVGQGTFKGHRPLVKPGGYQDLRLHTSPLEVMEARLVLEPEIARLAAMRATNADLQRLAVIAKKSRKSTDFETFSGWDSRFHSEIASATRHQLFTALFVTVDGLRTELAWGKLQRRSRTDEWLDQARAEHERIVVALSDRDPDAAAEAMRDHLRAVYFVLTKRD